jgi:hypothetical protein
MIIDIDIYGRSAKMDRDVGREFAEFVPQFFVAICRGPHIDNLPGANE